ncbi:hypothetical protein DM01DRAFT_1055778 [Hesseltinella vesiculosa]|uniref:Autophagy-related protein 2 n=1 Tax=Hesseltinella vesiculosa TaxID=101127 RepID=A0A1X2GFW3_9FUNG|nr:hypothetical protein DM01DRAFT_1055778 [Hesseltinella vesiculosa]
MKAWSYLSSGLSNLPLPSTIQKRLYKFLLRKALGQFLATDLDLDNFDIELVNGSLELRDLDLNLDTFNNCLGEVPLTVVHGHIASLTALLPWSNFWSGDIALTLDGLTLTVQPTLDTHRRASTSEDEDSPILSSSLHFADDFLKTDAESQELFESIQHLQESHVPAESPMDVGSDGVQVLTRVIEKMLAKVKVDVTNTVIKIIHPSLSYALGPADTSSSASADKKNYVLEIELPRVTYFDETPAFNDAPPTQFNPLPNMTESSILLPPRDTDVIKIITIASPAIWMRSPGHSPMSPPPSHTHQTSESSASFYSLASTSETALDDSENDTLQETAFYDMDIDHAYPFSAAESIMSGSLTPKALSSFLPPPDIAPYEALLLTTLQDNWIRLRTSAPQPGSLATDTATSVDVYIGHLRTIISPRQLDFLLDLASVALGPSSSPSPPPEGVSLASPPDPASTSFPTKLPRRFSTGQPLPPPLQRRQRPTSVRTDRPGAPPSFRPPQPKLKIKCQIPLLEHYFFYDDHQLPPASAWQAAQPPASFDGSHLKLAAHDCIGKWQRLTKDLAKSPATSFSSPTYGLQSTSSTCLATILDLKLQTVAIDEWVVAPPSCPDAAAPPTAIKMAYNRYIPLLETNHSGLHDYNDQDVFPAYACPSPSSVFDHNPNKVKKDALRLRFETRIPWTAKLQKQSMVREQEINVDIQPIKLTLDPNIANRLENYVYTLVHFQQHQAAKAPLDTVTPGPEPSVGQRIYEDLDHASREQHDRVKAKVRLAFLRLVLLAPDMSMSTTRDDFNDTFHGNLLSVDIKKVAAVWDTDLVLNHQPQKVTLDLDWINVFMKEAKDTMHRCWFTAKTAASNADGLKSPMTTPPNMEIKFWLTPPPQGQTSTSARPCYFGSGADIPRNLFENLSRNESFYCDQKVHIPMEDQADSAMVFKQRTVETSAVVINCHFPITHMSLSKSCWDKVQILQNDLLLWQPRFLSRLAPQPMSSSSSPNQPRRPSYDSLNSELFTTTSDLRFMPSSSASSSFMSQSHERFGAVLEPSCPSLLSLVVVLAEGTWDLHTVTDNKRATYRLQFTDFRYFSVIKHLAMDENVTTLDIEDLTLEDISNTAKPVPLVTRTLSKPLMPRKNTALVSLFSRLIMTPELSKQSKLTSIVVCNACYKFSPDLSFLDQLIQFQKMPEEMVFIDPPTQYIKVYAHVLYTSIDYKPLHLPSRAAVVIDNLQVVTDIVSGQSLVDVRTYIQNIDVFLVDDIIDLDENQALQSPTRQLEARQYWTLIGMKSVLTSRNLEAQVKIKLNDMLAAPDLDIAILNDILTLEGCTDSFQSLVNLATYISTDGDDLFPHNPPPPPKKAKRRSHTSLRRHQKSMMSSLDECAFANPTTSSAPGPSATTSISKGKHQTPAPRQALPPSTSKTTISSDLHLIEGFYSTAGTTKAVQNKQTSTASTKLAASISSAASSSAALRPRKPRRKQPHPTRADPPATEEIVRVLISDIHELDIVEDFFGMEKKKQVRKPVVDSRRSKLSLRVRDVDILWKMYHGYDWLYVQHHHSTMPQPPPSAAHSPPAYIPPMTSMSLQSSPSDPPFVHPYSSRASSRSSYHRHPGSTSSATDIPPAPPVRSTSPTSQLSAHSPPMVPPLAQPPTWGSPSTVSSLDSRRSFSQRHGGRGEADMELRIEGITFTLDIMPPEEKTVMHAHLTIRDLELVDNIKTSSWDIFFGYMRADERTSSLPREIDADMVVLDVLGVRPVAHDPTIEYRARLKTLPLRFFVDQDSLNFLVQFFGFNSAILHSSLPETVPQSPEDVDDDNVFFQQLEIFPIKLKIDYKPKYVNYDNIKEGQFAELVNLFRLEGAKLELNAVKLTGIRGFSKLLERLAQEWLPHIKQTQVPHMVSGVTPIRSMVNLGSGIADLVLLPLQQYRKDGRVIKGLQKGTHSFARSTAMELIKLSALLASGTQVIWEQADALLSTPSTVPHGTPSSRSNFIRSSQDRRQDQPGMPSSSLSPTSTVIGSRTSEDMVFVFTERHLDLNQ